MRLALLMDHPSPHMVGLLDALALDHNIAAQVVYFRPGAPERTWDDPPGDLPYSIAAASKRSATVLNIPAVLREMRKISADVWVINSCYTAAETWAAVWKLNRSGIPWVYMNERVLMHGYLHKLKRNLLSGFLKRAIGVVGMGQQAAAQYSSFANGSLPSISIPYYLDLNAFNSLPIATLPEPSTPITFLTASRMIHCKAYDVLFAACTELPEYGWKLTIAGNGPLRRKIEATFRARWGSDKVQFLGEIKYAERTSIFINRHVFVFPSRGDGWGVAPIEAMASGLPVISSDQVMSMREFIRNGENGYLVTSENATELAARMNNFISTPDRIPKMGLAARETLKDYRPKVGAKRLVNFLADITPVNHQLAQSPKSPSTSQDSIPGWRKLTEPPAFGKRIKRQARIRAKRAVIDFSLLLRPNFVANGNRILVYHLVLREDRIRFEEHLAFLKDHYQIVPAETLAARKGFTEGTPLLAITFDDGFQVLMSDAVELLEKHNLKATFYVPTGHVGLSADPDSAAGFSKRAHYYEYPVDPMTVDDLKQLRRMGHEVGSHGVSHIGLNALSQSTGNCELEESRGQLTSWLGESITGFAYPYGATKSQLGNVAEWVSAAGYEYAVTLKRGAVKSDSNLMLLPREHAEGNWRVDDLAYFLGR
jgi:glycosyltransferase involved in cell wall biosynthesis/peptidoglycan/xylan/chitin deacetylase (PgdA/CDA1 family)